MCATGSRRLTPGEFSPDRNADTRRAQRCRRVRSRRFRWRRDSHESPAGRAGGQGIPTALRDWGATSLLV